VTPRAERPGSASRASSTTANPGNSQNIRPAMKPIQNIGAATATATASTIQFCRVGAASLPRRGDHEEPHVGGEDQAVRGHEQAVDQTRLR